MNDEKRIEEAVARELTLHHPTRGMAVSMGVTCECGYWTGVEIAGETRPVSVGGRDQLDWHRAQTVVAAVRAQVAEEIATAIEEQLVQPNPCNDADDACAACAPLHRAARIARQYAVKPSESAQEAAAAVSSTPVAPIEMEGKSEPYVEAWDAAWANVKAMRDDPPTLGPDGFPRDAKRGEAS